MNRQHFHAGPLSFAAAADAAARLTEITSILADAEQVSALTDDEVAGLETELMGLADQIIDGTADGIDRNDTVRLTEISEGVTVLRNAAGERIAAAEATQADVDVLMANIRGEADGGEADGDEADASEGDDEDEADEAETTEGTEEADAETTEDESVLVTASASVPVLPSLADVAARVPASHRPAAAPAGRQLAARTEHPFIRAIERGQNVTLTGLANLFIEKHRDFSGMDPGRGAEKIRLGRLSIVDSFGEDRTLHDGVSPDVNDAKIDAVTAGAMRPEMWTDELVASGGFCAPTPADYEIAQISESGRPIRDSLPRFLADRGGIRFTPPPDLSDILVDQAGGAIGEWTNDTDISPGESTKTCQTVTCSAATEVLIKAIYRCLGFGNFGARAYPESVRAWTLNAAAAWARKAEQENLDSISASSVQLTSTGIYGFVSELLTHIVQLSVGERSRQRMDPEARLRVLLPDWVLGQMQIDYLRQGSVDTRLRNRGELAAMFAAANVNVTLYQDSRTGAGQVQGAQAAGVELRDLPEIVEWYLFHEGAFSHLDGGELDLGLVRDSTLNETNDFRIFAENFEEVAFRGIFSYRVRSTLCPNGERSFLLDGDPCGAS